MITEILNKYHTLVLNNLFVGLLFVKLVSHFFVKQLYLIAKEIIRWLIIGCATAGLLYWTFSLIDDSVLQQRAIGKYAWAFWIVIFFSDILPFTLLIKKIKSKGWAIFAILVLMNFGVGMEWLAVNGLSGSGWSIGLSFSPLLMFLGGGILAGLVLIGVSITILKFRKTELTKTINSK